MIRIDAHHHVWDLSVRDQDWITGEAMVIDGGQVLGDALGFRQSG